MPNRLLANRADEYRMRAKECRGKACVAATDKDRKALLEIADTWERLARSEDEHDPSPPACRST
jgi:hypothetical protein